MDDMQEMMDVEVAYAERHEQTIRPVSVPVGSSAIEAVRLSDIRDEFPQIPPDDELELGIFSKKCAADQVLQPGDRVEIYRPLMIDPKEARRLKAEVAEKRKKQAAATND